MPQKYLLPVSKCEKVHTNSKFCNLTKIVYINKGFSKTHSFHVYFMGYCKIKYQFLKH